MEGIRPRLLPIAATAAAAALIAGATLAAAVSGGGYQPSQQGCSPRAAANTSPGAQPGCHNAVLAIEGPGGWRLAEAGTYQDPQGQNLHAGDLMVAGNTVRFDTRWQPIPAGQCDLESAALYAVSVVEYLAGQGSAPCTLDPAQWTLPSQAPLVTVSTGAPPSPAQLLSLLDGGQIYFGADDNVNSGEHDGVSGTYGTARSVVGPSDGGAVTVVWRPSAAGTWGATVVDAVRTGDASALAADPFPMLTLASGFCADGICAGVYTVRTAVYHGGGGSGSSRNAYDYAGKTWDPYDCSSGSVQDERACISEGGHTMDWYRKQEAGTVYAEPGVQVYEDPDPQASPVLPQQLYPLPAVYAGTMGVVAGGGSVSAPASPVTNSAGQLVIQTPGT